MTHLERIEFDATADLFRAAPEAVKAAQRIAVRELAGATCMASRGVEPAAIFRRAVGLGVARPTTEAELDAVLEHMRSLGERFAIPLAPQYRPPELASWLETRGFTKGYAWMKFSRLCADPPQAGTDLDIQVVGTERSKEFGRVITEGFGLAAAVSSWVGALPGRTDWICAMAFEGGVPAGAGAAYVKSDYAWLGLGATLASHRRHGAQNALLALRLREAAKRGAKIAVTETGERLPDKPSNSYRNILRAGFEEAYLRQNYLSPAV